MITIRIFAGARELVGCGTLRWELTDERTVGDVWRQLCREHPALASLRLQGLAVNGDYVDLSAPVAAGDELAIIPPVSGG